MKKLTHLVLLFFALLLTDCATTGSMRNAPISEGVTRTFTSEFKHVLNAARESVVEAL